MYKCDYCNREYKHKWTLRRHTINNHPDRLEDVILLHRTCQHCSDVFETGEQLGAHTVFCSSNPKATESKKRLSEYAKNNNPCHTIATRELLSEIRSKRLEETGTGGFPHIKWYSVRNIENEEFIVRGTWERDFAYHLNELNIMWVRRVYIKYHDGNINRTYTPDFLLTKSNLYIEVKGYFSNRDKKKMKLVQEQNDINLITLDGKKFDDIIRKFALVSAPSYMR